MVGGEALSPLRWTAFTLELSLSPPPPLDSEDRERHSLLVQNPLCWRDGGEKVGFGTT